MSNGQLATVVRHIHKLAHAPTADNLGDGQLLELFSNTQEEDAFATLVRRHGPMVLGVCRRVLRDGHAAEDAFQATFLVLLRRARSLDRHGSVAGWLYTVAYRVALRARADIARRRQREMAAPEPSATVDPAATDWADLQPVIDEELARLPDHYRAPVLLCYLEGKTNAEAARLLGWPVGTVKGRLARAREMLRYRLGRRGVTLSAALLASQLGDFARAAVPGTLLHATTAAAVVPAAAPATVVALVEGALQTMFVAKLKIVGALLLTLGLLMLGFGASTPPAEAQRQVQFTLKPAVQPVEVGGKARPAPEQPADAPSKDLTVAGRILGADGKGLAGARVAVVGWASGTGAAPPKVLGEVTTATDGKFRLTVQRPDPVTPYAYAILATAAGHGMGWQAPLPQTGIDLQLQPEQVIKGRLIDLQGQPAAGIKVHITRLGTKALANAGDYVLVSNADNDDDEFDVEPARPRERDRFYPPATALVTDRSGSMKGTGEKPARIVFRQAPEHLPGWPATVITDAQGRFTIRGVGRGQGVGVQVRDERYALQVLDLPAQDKKTEEITHALAPVRLLEGVITDADTGKPIPYARLKVIPPSSSGGTFTVTFDIDGSNRSADLKGRRGLGYDATAFALIALGDMVGVRGDELPVLETRADANGRYRFSLFQAGNYTLRIAAARGEPYLQRRAAVKWPGEAVVRKQFDLTLQRGVMVKGKVTEADGGKAIAEARVDFWSKGLKLPAGVRYPRPGLTRADGTFEVMLPPGNWHLLVNGSQPLYLPAQIAADSVTDDKTHLDAILESLGGKGPPTLYPDAHAALDLKAGGATQDVSVPLRRAPLLRGRVVGPDGKDLTKVLLVRRPVVPFETTAFDDALAHRILDRGGQAELVLRALTRQDRPVPER
ncbi:MAG TPA: sigma-70 family RNA polymerase sigma factor, partial [Gemmataceae bacterium]|nr:sigma-70 family RNA polymerase sigma factor [Gemmataceae bacterium]